jgi:small multidrug resistance family-3 protein
VHRWCGKRSGSIEAGSGWSGASWRWGLTGSWRRCSPTRISAGFWAAYGGIFVAGSLAWAMVVDGFRPDRYDVLGALVCLAGVAVIMYAPRGQ